MNTKNNKRYADTEEKINRAIRSLLLKEKSLKKITVRDVCRAAQIHHTTFYEHYMDIFDLVEKVEQQIGNGLCEHIENKKNIHNNMLSVEFIKSIIEYVKDNKDFYKVYLNDHGLSSVDDGFNRVWSIIEHNMEYDKFDYNEVKYSFEFSKAGTVRVISCWLNNDCRESVEEISRILYQLLQQLQLRYPSLSENLFGKQKIDRSKSFDIGSF